MQQSPFILPTVCVVLSVFVTLQSQRVCIHVCSSECLYAENIYKEMCILDVLFSRRYLISRAN